MSDKNNNQKNIENNENNSFLNENDTLSLYENIIEDAQKIIIAKGCCGCCGSDGKC